MGRPSAFKNDAARTEYCRLYDEAIALSPVSVEESDVETSLGTTHVLTAGDPSKPPLVALHALSMSSTMWLPLLPTLTGSHHVRLLDALGDMNKSVTTVVMSSPARVVDWIDEVLDTLAIERSAFVAASLGTWMATHYAMARPERVERLAMLGPAGIVSPQYMKWLVEMLVKFRLRPTVSNSEWALDTFVMEKTRPRLRADPWRPIAQQFIIGMPGFRRKLLEPRPVKCNIDRLAASGIPVLVVIPRDETLHDGPTMAQRFRQQLPHAQVELVDAANHLVVIDRADVVAEHLQKFLGET